jgi:hypothetical protein
VFLAQESSDGEDADMGEGEKEKPKSEDTPPTDNRPIPRSPLTEMRDIRGTRDKKYDPHGDTQKGKKDAGE